MLIIMYMQKFCLSLLRKKLQLSITGLLWREGIFTTVVIQQCSNYRNCITTKSISFFQRFTDELRKKILGIIDRYITAPGENGLAKALLIGYRDNLDRDIITAYTNTGVIHVIAISGLHLGLIYALLAYLLKSFQKKNYLSTYRSIFIAAFLWIFSILCGASPSVLRSALMFTCLLAGEALHKENHTANALAASAFLLLCFDPMLLWDIGFQLSYAAVGSLLIYNRWISRLYSSGNTFLSFAWNSVSTSISAQILTTPLILYHFHQFPVLFVLSNLIAVPLVWHYPDAAHPSLHYFSPPGHCHSPG